MATGTVTEYLPLAGASFDAAKLEYEPDTDDVRMRLAYLLDESHDWASALAGWTYVDATRTYKVESAKITAGNIPNTAAQYFRVDKGAAHYGDFSIDFELNINSTGNNTVIGHVALDNGSGTYAQRATDTLGIDVASYYTAVGPDYRILLTDHDSGNSDLFIDVGLTGTYYCRLSRVGTAVQLLIWDDTYDGNLVDTLNVVGTAQTYQYLYAISGRAGPVAATITSAYTADVDDGSGVEDFDGYTFGGGTNLTIAGGEVDINGNGNWNQNGIYRSVGVARAEGYFEVKVKGRGGNDIEDQVAVHIAAALADPATAQGISMDRGVVNRLQFQTRWSVDCFGRWPVTLANGTWYTFRFYVLKDPNAAWYRRKVTIEGGAFTTETMISDAPNHQLWGATLYFLAQQKTNNGAKLLEVKEWVWYAGFAQDDPVVTLLDADSGVDDSVRDMSTFAFPGSTAGLTFSYAYGNGANPVNWSAYLTEANLKLEGDPVGRYFRLRIKVSSDGVTQREVTVGHVDCAIASGGYPALADVEAGVVYGSANEFTGTFTEPGVGNVKTGVDYGGGGVEFTGTYTPDFPAAGNVLDDDTVDGNPGTFTNVPEANVELGVQWGDGGVEFTGSYASAAPSTPALSFTDNEDGTGGVATVTGSDVGTTNTVYTMPDGGDSWTSGGSRAGDGVLDIALAEMGSYWGFISSASAGGVAVSAMVYFSVTDGTGTSPGGVGALIAKKGEAMTVQEAYDEQDDMGVRRQAWSDKSTLTGWKQAIDSDLRVAYEQRGLRVTHKVFTVTDPEAKEGWRLVDAAGTEMAIRGITNQAGLDRVWRIDVEELL